MQDIAFTSIIAGVMVPIILMIGGVIIALVAINRRHKLRLMEHQERMLAIEKGQPIPVVPNPISSGKKGIYPFAWPFVLIGFGLALTLLYIFAERDTDALGFGLISLFIGLGLFASRFYGVRKRNGDNDDNAVLPKHGGAATGIPEAGRDTEPTIAKPVSPPLEKYGTSGNKETES